MKTIGALGLATVICLGCQTGVAADTNNTSKWDARVDLGGSIPRDARLTDFAGPVSGQRMKLAPGIQFDLALNYRLT